MIPTRFALTLAAGLAVSCSAAAHTELQSADWCAQGIVMYIGDFTLTREELVAEAHRRQQAAGSLCAQDANRPIGASGGDSTCGVFDPPSYEVARAMALAACGAPESAAPAQDSGIVAFVSDPPSFNAADHHQTFNFDSGLSGLCGVCIPHRAIAHPIDHN